MPSALKSSEEQMAISGCVGQATLGWKMDLSFVCCGRCPTESSLEMVDLSDNHLWGPAPNWLDMLKGTIKSLNLTGNRLTGDYKALDNLGAFQRWFGVQPNTKAATLVFGLIHGFGLATKIQAYEVSPDGLLPNLLAFNVGVEIGQLLALAVILIGMSYWRRTAGFVRHAYSANVVMMSAGFILVGMQLTGYFVFQ
jgi:hypothetical protein